MHVMAPKNKWELSDMMKFAVALGAPIAVRYPRGAAYDGLEAYREPVVLGKAEWIYEEEQIALFAVGSMVKTAEEVRKLLKEEGYGVSLINARFVKPLDEELLQALASDYVITMEDNVALGGFGSMVNTKWLELGKTAKIKNFAYRDEFIHQGGVSELQAEFGVNCKDIENYILDAIHEG
jgi:1-deoxy-D-xylulose-5-phosphate synthase